MSPGRRRFEAFCGAALLCVAGPGRARPAAPDAAALDRACRDFRALAQCARRLAFDDRVAFVNLAINQCVDFAPDDPDDPDTDDWSTPLETLARGCGDCEDFAIAKYFLLLASDVPGPAARLLYARRLPGGRAHVVALARAPFVDPWVLDNINPVPLALSQRDDLAPVFSFDRHTIWSRAGTGATPTGIAALPIWQAVVRRAGEPCH